MADFSAWFTSHGGRVHPALDLFAALPNGDRGVVAKEDVEEGAVLVTVPHAITVHRQSKELKSCAEVQAYLENEHPGTSPFLCTVLVLLREWAKGDGSELLPYLQTLPGSCGCLLSWTDGEKEHLKGTSIEDTGDDAQGVFEREVLPRIAGKADWWPAPYNTLPQFELAASLVQSRAFHLNTENWLTGSRQEGTDLYLIPAIDMINHSTDKELRNTTLHSYTVAPSSGSSSNAATQAGPFFSMKAEKPIKAGQQVFHTYGDLSDAQLLQTYGFIDCPPSNTASSSSGASLQHNPHNSVLLDWESVVAACRSALTSACQGDKKELRSFDATVSSKLSLLTLAHVVEKSSVPGPVKQTPAFLITQQEPLPDALLTTIQVLLMAEDDVNELRQEYEQDRKKKKKKGSGDASASDVASDEAEQEPLTLGTALLDEDEGFAQVVALAMIQVADKASARYPSSLKQDELLLKNSSVPERQRLAVMVRQGERHVLLALKKKGLELLMSVGDGDE